MSEAKKRVVDRFWVSYRRADAAYRDHRYEEAIGLYRETLVLKPGHEATLNHLANCYLEVGNTTAAVASLESILEHHAMNARAHARIGVLYSSPKHEANIDLTFAEQHFQLMLALNRADSGPHYQLGRVALYRGILDRAIASLRDAHLSDSRGVAVGRHLARALVLDGQRAAAADVLAGVLRKGLAAASPAGMTAEGETLADRELQSLYSSRYITVVDDLRRLDEWTRGSEYRAAAARLEPAWPRWRPDGLESIANVADGRPEAMLTLERDLDGDGYAERIVAKSGSLTEALIARIRGEKVEPTVLPTVQIERRDNGTWIDVTSDWLGDVSPLVVPIACLVVDDFDGDGRLDVFIGCGSADPLDVHPDLVLRQLESARFEVYWLDDGGRGTRAVNQTDDAWILWRSSAFPAADGAKSSSWRRP